MAYSIFETMITIGFRSGDILREYFENHNYSISQKTSSFDLVTTADKESQKIIVCALSSRHPGIAVIGEEGAKIEKHAKVFYVDPLDGTLNFVHKIPFFAVSIGYWENGEALIGVVFDPIRKNLFYAKKGEGAFLNRKRIKVSSPKSLGNALLVTGWPYNKDRHHEAVRDVKSVLNFTEVRALGSAALELCYIATGTLDGYWEYSLSPWDLAAGVLIAKEAGAVISTPSGEEFDLFKGDILAIAPSLFQEFIALIKKG
jgi:myo-inositol-1(or 4)-monophosphatase